MEPGIGKEFMELTRHGCMEKTDQRKGLPCPGPALPCEPAKQVIDLPCPDVWNVDTVTITEAIVNRKSLRNYADSPLSIPELSYLLWCTQGVKEVIPGTATFRTVPSAGARHAFETYLLVNNVTGLTAGLYRFLAVEHKLAELKTDSNIADVITEGCLGQKMVTGGAVTFIWTAVPYRMTWRYGERGYRYIHLDAGHVCQNLYLTAEAIGCGVCAIAAFDDVEMNRALSLDGVEQFVIYIAAVGKKEKA